MHDKAFIVSLTEIGRTPRPSFGAFRWNPTYNRYVWRDEVAVTLGQLADLINQASDFLREQENYFLKLVVVGVPREEAALARPPARRKRSRRQPVEAITPRLPRKRVPQATIAAGLEKSPFEQ